MSEIIESLLKEKPIVPQRKQVLIEEVGSEEKNISSGIQVVNEKGVSTPAVEIEIQQQQANTSPDIYPKNNEPDGPSMLDLMMAAQSEAAKAIVIEKKKEVSKPLGNGFKKGFFGSNNKAQDKKDIIDVTARKYQKGEGKSAVLKTIQNAVVEEKLKEREEREKKFGPVEHLLSKNGCDYQINHSPFQLSSNNIS